MPSLDDPFPLDLNGLDHALEIFSVSAPFRINRHRTDISRADQILLEHRRAHVAFKMLARLWTHRIDFRCGRFRVAFERLAILLTGDFFFHVGNIIRRARVGHADALGVLALDFLLAG